MPCWAQRPTVPTLRSPTLVFWSPWSKSRPPLSVWMCPQVSVHANCRYQAEGSETQHDRWVSRQLPGCFGSQAGVFQVWRHTWRINLMLQSAQCELIIPRIHNLLSVSTTGRKWSQSSAPYMPPFLSLLFVFLRLGCRRTESGWDQPRRSHLSHSTKEVRHEFLGEAFLGRTLPALWHPEKIRA